MISAARTRNSVRPHWCGRRTAVLTTSLVLAMGAVSLGALAPAAAAHPAAAAAVGSAVPAAAPAAAVGHLSARNCAEATGTAACDLYAMSGTAAVLGNNIPIWGFSTTATAGSATAPGPVLVVNQGDQVSITVHNSLTGEQLSLALPGQVGVTHAGGAVGDDTTGVATGGTASYSFKATRAGTFLYEAGHTVNGARQVAMGLAGALVVLPADGSAYGTTANYPATAYDDDAVLVMSEIDPDLNADPANFDMRNFAPKYRMFNGKPYPASDPVSTDQGHTVLLRYVNAGSQTHAMSLLGGDQVEIAQDGHQLRYQSTVTAESVDPGQTLDVLVKMPTGPEAKLAVYEPAQHLDNNGQHGADPTQIAFGGLLTFLDTNAPPPSTDGVGPSASHLKVSPNPSDGKADVSITADLSDAATGGSAIDQAEFVLDDPAATGPGFGTSMTATYGTVSVSGAAGVIPAGSADTDCQPAAPAAPPLALKCLSAGTHTIYVRAHDTAGNWGVVSSVILNLPKTGPQTTGGSVDSPANGMSDIAISATGDDSAAGGTIVGAEYFVDTPGADGSGISLPRNRTASIVSEDGVMAAADVLALGEGVHHILVHSKDSLGLWGPLLDIPLTVDLTGPTVDAASVGPNPSNTILSNKSNPGYLYISAQITDRDAGGAMQSNLIDAEAFVDSATKPAGTGLQLIAVDGSLNSPQEAVYGLLPLSQVKALTEGTHSVYVHGQDAAGTWGPMFAVKLVIDKTAPKLGTVTASPNPTNGAPAFTLTTPVTEAVGVSTAEYWAGTTDPGVGKGIAVPVSVVNGAVTVTIPTNGLLGGVQQFNLRVQDTAGNWSTAGAVSVNVIRPNAIFSDMFETPAPAWSSRTGTVSNSTAAKMTVLEPTSTQGLSATISNFVRTSSLTDTTPAAETSYKAKFMFNRNNLTAGNANNALTIFEGRNATAQVFAVQFRLSNGTSGTPQLRLVLQRGGIQGAATGAWVNLGSGAHSVQVEWSAASNGSAILRIDGASVQTVTGNNSALKVETAVLGITQQAPNGASGTAYFDSFTSARTTI